MYFFLRGVMKGSGKKIKSIGICDIHSKISKLENNFLLETTEFLTSYKFFEFSDSHNDVTETPKN